MSEWIHFTDDIDEFIDGIEEYDDDDPASFCEEGLFVYKYHSNFPIEERSVAWGGRIGMIISCDENHVEIVQEDPLGDDPDNDEYIIPVENFQFCEILN